MLNGEKKEKSSGGAGTQAAKDAEEINSGVLEYILCLLCLR